MLNFFSRLEKTRNVVLFVFAALMALSLILFYAPTRGDERQDLTLSDETAAKVGGERITVGELAILQKLSGQKTPRLLSQLIESRVVRSEARRFDLTATDAEVKDSFVSNRTREAARRAAAGGRTLTNDEYEQSLTKDYGSLINYERLLRDQVSGQKLIAFLTSGATVSEDEILNDYRRKNTKFELSYVPISSQDLAQTLKPGDEELKNYFDKNKANYFISVPQKKIRYIFLNTTKIGEKINFSEEELRAEYDKVAVDKKQAGVEAQQIVLKIPKPEQESLTATKAGGIVEQARARGEGGKISADAFAELAKGQSEDPRTAANGGKLPGLVREKTDPYQRLLTMQPGEITEPIKYQDKYYILRRGEAVAKSFEDARKELETSLRIRRAYGVAVELAKKVGDSLKQSKDVQKTAQEFAAQVNMTPAEMVRETAFVKPGDDVPNIGSSQQFEEGIAPLENQGDVGELIPVKEGFAIPLLVDKREPRDAEFDEVKNQIAETVKVEQARARVEEIAGQIASGANSATDLAAAAQSKGLKALEAKSFILGSPLGQGASAQTSDALETAIYDLRVGEVTKTPVKIGNNYFVVGVRGREEASSEEFAKQRDDLVQAKLSEKREQVFSEYLAAKKQELEAKNEINIDKNALAKLDAGDKTTTVEEE